MRTVSYQIKKEINMATGKQYKGINRNSELKIIIIEIEKFTRAEEHRFE